MEDKKPIYTLIVVMLMILSVILVLYSFSITSSGEDTKESGGFTLMTKEVDGVTVSALPIGSGSQFNFQIELDTHFIELSYKLEDQSYLVSDVGEVIKPLRWEGDPPVGHHRKGVLIFPTFNSTPKGVTLYIEGVEGNKLEFSFTTS